ncbi:MAG: hypothetical protein CYPHOPRED_002591 [Cyphobasidiales sp. Tagirdzhanova-0007]|nr:MAG: hypothetical protein CYPHOPRED_002591 [Cyphobasidiales sp. Tagirdzhanova-0007]
MAIALIEPASHERRSVSLDLGYSSNPAFNNSDANKRTRLSLSRLAFPPWRADAEVKDEAMRGLELQAGYATPYTAHGSRGGFALDNTDSFATSIGRSLCSSRDEEDPDEASLRTSGSSKTRVLVSPSPTPSDSGFAEFGPDSVIDEEMECRHEQTVSPIDAMIIQETSNTNRSSTVSRAYPAGGEAPVAAAHQKKARSRGWFSFSSSIAGSAYPLPNLGLANDTLVLPEANDTASTPRSNFGSSTATKRKAKLISPTRSKGSSSLIINSGGKRGDLETSV